MRSSSLLAFTPSAKRPRTEATFDAHVVSRMNPAPARPAPASTAATGIAFPTSLADVKRQLAEAKAARAAVVEKEEAERKAARQKKREEEASTKSAAVKSASPGRVPDQAALRAIRLQRESLMAARQELVDRLSFITWIEFRRQANAIDFMRKQQAEKLQRADSDVEELSSTDDLALFAYELAPRSRSSASGAKPHSGARKFILSSYRDFWTRYFTFPESRRHHYELVLEGRPCHLYFDIEFKYEYNRQFRHPSIPASDSANGDLLDVEEVMAVLCDEIVEHLNQRFSFQPPVSTKQILQLDSSSSVKFSRHLIVRLDQEVAREGVATDTKKFAAGAASRVPPPPTFMFADNAHAGRLVRSLCTDITRRAQQSEDADLHEAMEAAERRMAATTAEEKQGIDSELAALQHRRRLLRGLLIHERDPAVASAAPASHAPSASEAYDPFQPASTAVMIDQSVYTRNRSFRLLLSSKNAPAFLVSPPSQSGYDAFTHPPPQLESPPVLLVSARNEFPLQGVELKDIFRATLISNVECTRDRLKLLTFNERDEAAVIPATEFSTTPASQDVSTVSVGGSTNPNGKRIRAAAASSSGSSTSRRFHSGPSPFPRVEKFLLQHIHSPASNGSKTTATSQDGRISGWTYVKDSAGGAEGDNSVLTRHSITFNLSYHRYCGNVGRAHVSNGVYYVVDLLARTMDQRCWDHDCRYYRSPPITVPNFVVDMDLDDQDQEAEEIDADA